MPSTSETGHSVNLAIFKTFIDYCSSYGNKYQPSNSDLVIATMTIQWKDASDAHKTATDAFINAKNPIAQRKTVFAPLDKLVTKTLNYYESTKADKQKSSRPLLA